MAYIRSAFGSQKTLYMTPVNQTVDIDECKKFIEFAKILW